MKRFALVALLAAMLFGIASSVSATELKVKGNLDVYGMWSANLRDFDSDNGDADNYFTSQRMRTYFTFQTNENLKAVLGLEMNSVWGQTGESGAGWGTDGRENIRVKHAYLDFVFPDTQINVKAGLQAISLPSVFGNPVFDDDAAALVVSAPINDMVGIAVGYTRGTDTSDNYDDAFNSTGGAINYDGGDDKDMLFLAAPVTMDGFSVTPYLAYAVIGENVVADREIANVTYSASDDTNLWVLGANAKLTMFDPLTFAADLIYGQSDWEYAGEDVESDGWYTALMASYKLEMMTASLFGTYATGFSDDANELDVLPSLAEGFELSPYLGGARAFNTGISDGFAGYTWGDVGLNGLGIWTVGVKLSDISFVEKLSHDIMLVYAEGTSDKDAGVMFDEKDSAWEFYMVNKYMIFENLAAINELGYFAPDYDGDDNEDDSSYFTTIGFSYQF